MNLIRLLLKSFLFYVVIPLLLLSGIELFLRYEGWGKNLSPWIEHTTEQGKVYTKNLDFYQQFFEHPVDPGEFEPYITAIKLPKPQGTIRIFVFGESAALGWPDAKYGFGKFLEAMLNQMYPQYHWEIFSLCFAGINSHVLRYVAQNSLFLQPDIVLIYMGNNEVHGTFGLLHDFKNSIPQPPWLVQLQIQIQDLYLTQNLKRIPLFRKKSVSHSQIRFDNPNLTKVNNYFENNLKAIIDTFISRKIPVFVGTMASNLRDWPPKDSYFKENISQEVISLWEKLIDSGIENLINDNVEEAKKNLKKSFEIDNSPALPYFLLGWCFIAEKNYEEARKNFIEAREKDGFGFVRSKQFINETIEKVTKEYGESNRVFLVPVEQELASYAFAGTPGNDMFTDSCHFNFNGAYLTACAYLRYIIAHCIPTFSLNISNPHNIPITTYDEAKLLLGIPANENEFVGKFMINSNLDAVINYPTISQAKDMRNFLTLMHQRFLPNSLKKDSPLSGTYDFSVMEFLVYHFDFFDKQKPYGLIIKYLEALKMLGAFRQGTEIIEKLLKDKGNDINYYYLAIDFYLNSKNYSQLDTLLQKFQQNYAFHDISEYRLKYAILKEDWNEAITLSNKIISNPFNSSTKKALFQCFLIEKNHTLSSDAKFQQWKSILQKSQWSWDSFDFVYQAAKKLGKVDEYKKMLIEIVNDKPTSPFPYNFLAFIYEDEGEISRAIEMTRQAISISVKEVSNYYELSRLLTLEAEQLFDNGKVEEANNRLEEAVKSFPYYLPAWNLLIETCKVIGDEEGTSQKIYEYNQIQNKGIMKHLWEIIY